MSAGPLLFLATFFAMSVSWLSFVLVPELQLGRQVEVATMDNTQYPSMQPGMARQGEVVYRANGCFYCHTEQVRPEGYGTDVERGWGARKGRVQSVDEDYLFEQTVMLGCQRVGPDLANIGCRQTNAAVLLKHIYDARLVLPNSIMPPYRFLFEERLLKPGQAPAADALDLGDKAPLGKEVVPTEQARQLAAYLLSLHETGVIFETPPPQPPPTNAPAAATNASATNTAK